MGIIDYLVNVSDKLGMVSIIVYCILDKELVVSSIINFC